jgi:hypothetical protein
MTNKLYDEVFFWFEQNEFKNNGVWDYDTNLIFEFADWLDTVEDCKIATLTNSTDTDRIRAELKRGVDLWLEKNHKNIMG